MAQVSPRASQRSLYAGWGSLGGNCGYHQTFPPTRELVYLWPHGQRQLFVCERGAHWALGVLAKRLVLSISGHWMRKQKSSSPFCCETFNKGHRNLAAACCPAEPGAAQVSG